MDTLEAIRQEIDKVDSQIIKLFKHRMECAKAVGLYKKEHKIPILNNDREEEILNKIQKLGAPYSEATKILYGAIIDLSRTLQYAIVNNE